MIGTRDASDLFIRQFAMRAVDHDTELARVDEKDLAAAVAVFVVFRIASEEPEAGGNLCGVKELAGQRDHAVDEIGFDYIFSDFAFAGLVRRHRAVGEDEAGETHRRKVMDDVLHPGEVGIARGRLAELPPFIIAQAVTAPVRNIERRVGENEIGLEVRVAVVVERVAVTDLTVDAA